MSRSIATKVTIEGEKQYTSALKNINSELKMLQSEMKATTAQYQTNANSQEALNAKLKVLNESYQKQQDKISTLNDAIAKGKAAQEQWRAVIANTQTALNDVNSKLSALDASVIKDGEQWNRYKNQLDAAEAELRELKNSTGDTTEEQAELSQKIEDLKTKMSELDTSTDGVASATGNLLTEQDKLEGTLTKQQTGYANTTTKVNNWTKQLNDAKTASYNLNAESEKTRTYLAEAEKAADGCATSIDKFGKEVKDTKSDLEENSSAIEDMNSSFQSLSSLLAASKIADAIRAVSDALKECVQTTADFTYTMATVEATSGATQEELSALEDQAKEYASNSIFLAQDVANAYQIMAQAGWTAQDMLDGMSGIMNLSAASTEDLGDVTNITVDALTAFGYSASDASRFADVLAEAAAASNTSVALMGNSFEQVASTAGAMGYTIEDVSTALAVMANNGLKGETAGAALSTALTRMAGGNETATNAMDALNISMMDSSGQARDLGEFLSDLRSRFANLTDEQKINYAYQLAGQRGMKGLLAIINTSEDDWNAMAEAIDNCNGAAEEMANIQLDTYTGQVQLLESATEGLQIAVGEKLTPALGDLAERFTGVLSGITEWISSSEAATPIIAGLTTGIGAFAAAVAVGTAAVSAAKIAVQLFGTALGTAVPVLAVVSVAVGALAAAFTYASSQGDDLENSIEGINSASESLNSANNVTALAEQYSALREQAQNTSLTEDELAAVEAQLNTVREQLAEVTNDAAIAQGEANAATDAAVEKQKTLAEAEQARANQDIYTNLVSGAKEYQETLEAQADKRAELSKREELYNATLEQLRGITAEANKEIEENGAVSEETAGKLDRVGKVAQGFADDCDELQAELDELTGTTDEYKNATLGLVEDGFLSASEAATLLGVDARTLGRMMDAYRGTTDKATDSTTDYSDATEDATEGTEDLGGAAGDTTEELDEEAEAAKETKEALIDIASAAIDARYSSGDLREEYENLSDEFEKLKDEGDDLTVALVEQKLEMLNHAATVQELDNAYGALAEQVGISTDQIATWLIASGQDFDDFQSAVSDAESSIINSFEKMDSGLEMSVSDMKKNLASNIEAQSEWSSNIATLWNAAVESGQAGATEFVQTLYAMGPEAASQVATMVQDVDGTLADFAPLFANAGAEAVNQAGISSAMAAGALYDTTSGIGEEAANAYAESGDWAGAGETQTEETASGIEGGTDDVTGATEEAAQAAIDAWNSQSSSFNTAGKNAMTSLSLGMSGQKATIGAAAKDAAMSAHTAIASIGWYSLGKAISQGVANGISQNSYLIKNAATSAASAAYEAAKATLDINSPSKVMVEVGRSYDEGFATGIAKGTDDVVESVNAMTRQSIPDVTDLRERASNVTNITNQYGSNTDRQVVTLLQTYLPDIYQALKSGTLSEYALAGQLTPYIDKNLGMTAKRKGRGN